MEVLGSRKPLALLSSKVVALAFVLLLIGTAAHAQTFTVIHSFLGGPDGNEPAYGLTIDPAGNIYGSTFSGDDGTGTIFRLRYRNSNWQVNPLYVFTGGPNSPGAVNYSGVIIGAGGVLFGTTAYGGEGNCATWGGTLGCGTVFKLRPPITFCVSAVCYWQETRLFQFDGAAGGATPYGGMPVFDHAGNLYGTTYAGGGGNCSGGCGLVYELTPSNGSWTQTVLYRFNGGTGDGSYPWAGVVFDQAGNLYGTTQLGGQFGYGTIYQLTPSGSGWTEKVLYNFQRQHDGGWPYAGVVLDAAGNLYGATTVGGTGDGGTVFELSPSGSDWNYQTLCSFQRQLGELAGGPVATPLMDTAGNLYGATGGDGAFGFGSVFKATNSGGTWSCTPLYNFTSGNDGRLPRSNLVMDSSGNLYGTAAGGANGYGVAYQITP
jgi:uncharacterized repeat protein (TIGR03803 family)